MHLYISYKLKRAFTLLVFVLFSITANAQLEDVYVETYYVSNLVDASDTTGGKLEEGSTTYRIFIVLKEGSSLLKIYGDVNHPLKFSSKNYFFNHNEDGKTFGNELEKRRYNDNTVALDSWLALGQVIKSINTTSFYSGIKKLNDTDGSIIKGVDGLLSDTATSIGIPLKKSDGLIIKKEVPPNNWVDKGFRDFLSKKDSTMFGPIIKHKSFQCTTCYLGNSGVTGVSGNNSILVAQLTTKGEISFELNIVVKEPNGVNFKEIKYVASDSVELLSDEKFSSFLKYPKIYNCGCKDFSFLEYKPKFECENMDSCKTLKVFGCTDILACNFDSKANMLLANTCCYPGLCNDRDISLVCPELKFVEQSPSLTIQVYPNPANDILQVQILSETEQAVSYSVVDLYGKAVLQNNTINAINQSEWSVDVSSLSKGMYLFRVRSENQSINQLFVKN